MIEPIQSRFASEFGQILRFVDQHRGASLFMVWIFVAKSVVGVLTPLSADFLLTGAISSSQGIFWVLGKGTPAVLWILVQMVMYHVWLLLPVQHPPLTQMMGLWFFTPGLSSFLLVFLYKLPLIIFNFGSAFLIYRIASVLNASEHAATMAALLWLVNPYVTLMSEMWSGYDVVAQFFVLVSVWLILRGRAVASAFALDVGVALKLYPLVLLPVYVLHLLKQGRSNLRRFVLAVLLPICLMVGVLLWISARFVRALADYLLAQAIFFRQSAFETVLPAQVAVAVTLVTAFVFLIVSYSRSNGRLIVDSIFGMFLVLFAITYWHPQYFVWVLPFVTLDYAIHRVNPLYPIVLVGSAFSYVLIRFGYYFSSYGNSVFFIPNYNSQLKATSNIIYSLFATNWDGPVVIALRALFLGSCMLYLLRILRSNSEVR